MEFRNAPSFKVMKLIKKDNGIGGYTEEEVEETSIKGYLDLLVGVNGENASLNAFLQETSHVLLTSYSDKITNKNWIIDSNGNRYNIVLVDNPINLKHHLEIYLKFIGEYNV